MECISSGIHPRFSPVSGVRIQNMDFWKTWLPLFPQGHASSSCSVVILKRKTLKGLKRGCFSVARTWKTAIEKRIGITIIRKGNIVCFHVAGGVGFFMTICF